MSTRSAIIQKTSTGYRGIYCHSDGYIEGVGHTLRRHYQDTDKITRLIDLGDISTLGERVEPISGHKSFYDREPGTTYAYRRDRGDREDVSARVGKTIKEVADQIGHNGHVYCWDGKRWTHNGRIMK